MRFELAVARIASFILLLCFPVLQSTDCFPSLSIFTAIFESDGAAELMNIQFSDLILVNV